MADAGDVKPANQPISITIKESVRRGACTARCALLCLAAARGSVLGPPLRRARPCCAAAACLASLLPPRTRSFSLRRALTARGSSHPCRTARRSRSRSSARSSSRRSSRCVSCAVLLYPSVQRHCVHAHAHPHAPARPSHQAFMDKKGAAAGTYKCVCPLRGSASGFPKLCAPRMRLVVRALTPALLLCAARFKFEGNTLNADDTPEVRRRLAWELQVPAPASPFVPARLCFRHSRRIRPPPGRGRRRGRPNRRDDRADGRVDVTRSCVCCDQPARSLCVCQMPRRLR